MATKDNFLSFKDNQNVFVESDNNNLNLNQNYPCSANVNACLKPFKTDNKKDYKNDLSHFNDLRPKNNLNSWKKSAKDLSATFLNLNHNFEDKNELKKAIKSSNNDSTLSLHIAAYENSIEATNDSNGCEKEVEPLSFVKKWGPSNHFIDRSALIIQNPFEFPRQQQDDKGNHPEVMQFAASQTLLNPSQAAGGGTTSSVAASTGPSESGTINNNNNNGNSPVTEYSRSTVGKGKRSVGRSTERRRRKKKHPKIPEEFSSWPEEDKKDFYDVTKLMKHWKATQRQCIPIISNVGRFKSLKQKMKPDEQYKKGVKEYEESLKDIPKIASDQSFDFEAAAASVAAEKN